MRLKDRFGEAPFFELGVICHNPSPELVASSSLFPSNGEAFVGPCTSSVQVSSGSKCV